MIFQNWKKLRRNIHGDNKVPGLQVRDCCLDTFIGLHPRRLSEPDLPWWRSV